MSAALAFLSGLLAVAGLGLLATERPPRARLAGGRAARILRALAVAGARLRRITGARAPPSLEQRIAAAGAPAGLGPRELIAAKLATALCGAAAGTVIGAAAPGRLGPLLVAVAPAAAFLAPDWWLRRRAADRAKAARRELPALLDLLRVTVDAGLPPAAAFAAVGGRATGILAAEWRTVGSMCGLGVPLSESLAGLVARLPLPEVRALVAALDRAARHGVPLSDTLAAQARDARLARCRQIEEEAARAGPKIQLVVALLLVPSVLLLVAAALAAGLLGGGGLTVWGGGAAGRWRPDRRRLRPPPPIPTEPHPLPGGRNAPCNPHQRAQSPVQRLG